LPLGSVLAKVEKLTFAHLKIFLKVKILTLSQINIFSKVRILSLAYQKTKVADRKLHPI
jgi:hypothetical protein